MEKADDNQTCNAVFNLMRRLPPNQVAKSLAGVSAMIENEDTVASIVERVDQPLGK